MLFNRCCFLLSSYQMLFWFVSIFSPLGPRQTMATHIFPLLCVLLVVHLTLRVSGHSSTDNEPDCSHPFLGEVLSAFKAGTDVITPFAQQDVIDCHKDCLCIRGSVCRNKQALLKSCLEVCPKSFNPVLNPLPEGCAVPDLIKKTGLTETDLSGLTSGSQIIGALLKANCPPVCKCFAAVVGKDGNPNFCKTGCKLYLHLDTECPMNEKQYERDL